MVIRSIISITYVPVTEERKEEVGGGGGMEKVGSPPNWGPEQPKFWDRSWGKIDFGLNQVADYFYLFCKV